MINIALGERGFCYFCAGNAIKYLWRHKYKNGKEDLDKAAWYIDKLGESAHLDDLWESLSNIHELYRRKYNGK